MTQRTRQVESLLIRAISEVVYRHLSDPRMAGIVSVTKVDVTPDLSQAQIYVSVLPAKYQQRTIEALNHAAGYITSLLRKMVTLRAVPRLEFRSDKTLKRQATVLEAIQRGLAREQPAEPQPTGDAAEEHLP